MKMYGADGGYTMSDETLDEQEASTEALRGSTDGTKDGN